MSPLLEATYSDELSPHSQLLATIATTKQVLVPTGVSQSGTRCLLAQTWESAFKKKKRITTAVVQREGYTLPSLLQEGFI